MLKLSRNAITNLIANYKSVLSKMFVNNHNACKKQTAALLACLFMVSASPAMAADYNVTGSASAIPTYANLQGVFAALTTGKLTADTITFKPTATGTDASLLTPFTTNATGLTITLASEVAGGKTISGSGGAASFLAPDTGHAVTINFGNASTNTNITFTGFTDSVINSDAAVTIQSTGTGTSELVFLNNAGGTSAGGAIVGTNITISGPNTTVSFYGNTDDSTNPLNVSGTTLTVTGATVKGEGTFATTGAMTFDGNAKIVLQSIGADGVAAPGTMTLTSSGDSVTFDGVTLSGAGEITATSSNIILAANNANALTVDSDDDIKIGAILAIDGVPTGGGGLVKDGAGTLTLTGANTFTGNVNFKEGTIIVGNDDALGASNALLMSNDTTLGFLDGAGTTNYAVANAITLSGGTAEATIDTDDIDGTVTLSGAITVGKNNILHKIGEQDLIIGITNAGITGTVALDEGDITIASGADSALGTGKLIMADETTLKFASEAAARTLGNDIIVNAEGAEATINTTNVTSVVLTGSIAVGEGNVLHKTGAVDLIINKSNNTGIVGTIALDEGTISIGTAGTNNALGTGTLLMADNTSLEFGSAAYKLANAITVADDPYGLPVSATINTSNATDVTLNGAVTVGADNTLVKAGSADLIINSSDNNITGTVDLSAGKIVIGTNGANNALGTGELVMANTTTLGFIGSAAAYTLGNDITVASGAGATVDTGTRNVTLNGNINLNSGDTLDKTGVGTLTIMSDNTATYDGGIQDGSTVALEAGTLKIGNNYALGSGGLLMDKDTVLGFVDGAGAYALDNDISMNDSGAAGKITVDTGASNVALNGILDLASTTSANTFVKNGDGTLTLTNTANDYGTGSTININKGTLAITAAEDALTATTLATVNNNAWLSLVGDQQGSFYEKDMAIGTYRSNGSDTIGLQASFIEGDVWSDYVTIGNYTGKSSTSQTTVHFDMAPGSNPKHLINYMEENDTYLGFAKITGTGDNGERFAIDKNNTTLGVYKLGVGYDETGKEYYIDLNFDQAGSKVYSEVAAAGIGQASAMHGDMLFNATSQAARGAGSNTTGIFAGYGRMDSRFETGSHADVDGNNFTIAVGFKANEKTSWGVFGQMFKGNSETNTGNAINSSGDMDAHDFGLFVEHRPGGQNEDGSGNYFKGVVRFGKVNTDFRANNGFGSSPTTFTMGRNVFGMSLGGGSVKVMEGDKAVDYYGHLIYTGLGGNTVTDSIGQEVNFSSSNSFRLLTGLRLNFNQSKKTGAYVGAALDYEFSGKSDSFIDGFKAEKADLSGITGILEVGLATKLGSDGTSALNLGLQGYLGKRQGIGGTLTFCKWF